MAVWVKLIAEYALYLYAFCAVGVLIFLRVLIQARQERNQALFTLEREAASSKAFRSVLIMLAFLALGGGVYATETYIAPQVELPREQEAKVIPPILLTPTPTRARSTPTLLPPTATPTPRPTRRPRPPTVTPTPTVPPAPPDPCPGALPKITAPAMNATLKGLVAVVGSATAPNFWYWKLEWAQGGFGGPEVWHSIGEQHFEPAPGGQLDVWNVDLLPGPGPYRLKLTIVDITGNYPPNYVCQIQINVQR